MGVFLIKGGRRLLADFVFMGAINLYSNGVFLSKNQVSHLKLDYAGQMFCGLEY